MSLFLFAAVAAFLLSGLVTFLSNAFLTERIAIAGTFLGLERSLNPGIAFGVRLPGPFQEIVIATALLLVLILAWRMREFRSSQAGFGLIVGGALANLLDRLPDGTVTDYFQAGSFPVFNMADSCITVGVVLLLAESLWREKAAI